MARQQSENRLILESRFDEVARAQQLIIDAAERCGYDDTELFAVKLALEEALTNAIKHGNRLDPNKHVTLAYDVSPRRITIEICDEGGGFRPDAVPDPTLDENLERPCGRGVMLMKAYMSEVEFNPAGNCVTMTKFRGR